MGADPYYVHYGRLGYGYGLGYYGLGHLGYYGLWGRKRRSADAEPVPDAQPAAAADPDPYLLYGGHLGYLGYYGYLGRKRRSADADAAPDAEPAADPYLLYGHGLGYYGGYYPYYYGARYYYGR